MGSHPEETGSATLPEKRIVLIGSRWGGKSWSGNTILSGERFECGRIRTTKVEVRHGEVEGSRLTLVDTPGWSTSLSLTEIPEGEKQRFKLYASKSPPGPHVFLLVVPIDTAFTQEQKTTLEEHIKLLGERVWRFTMVLFTCGDYPWEKTMEQHIAAAVCSSCCSLLLLLQSVAAAAVCCCCCSLLLLLQSARRSAVIYRPAEELNCTVSTLTTNFQ